MKAKYIVCLLLMQVAVLFGSCTDFFEQDSDHVQYTDDYRLHEPGDSIYALTGIMNKMQALGDRTILLGELRGDLVDVTANASADLRGIADFDVNDDNAFNSPKDYYAVINNCNLYIARCDTAVKNNRGEKLFYKEYAAVKAYRAWTYLQLVLNYGKVPFVTTPITTEAEANADYETKDLQGICQYFIADLTPLVDVEYPGLGAIGSVDSRLLYFPISWLLGDLNLWAGNYKQAALDYYHFISTANGTNSYFQLGTNSVMFDSPSWNLRYATLPLGSETYSSGRSVVTMIAGDSIPSQGNYSQLRNYFNTNENNDYKASITPSRGMQALSASQKYCYMDSKLGAKATPIIAPGDLSNNLAGDLRLSYIWSTGNGSYNGKHITTQSIRKYMTRNIAIYTRPMVYLRLAEALNRAGYPRFAFQILARGVNNDVIGEYVLPYCHTASDSAFVSQFNFPSTANTGYIVRDITSNTNYNTIGIHSRGCGWTEFNPYYQFPTDSLVSDTLNYQIEKVEDLIMDENALECCFQGTRFYDLMRVALRRNDPAYLADRVYKRDGLDNVGTVKGTIKKDLYDPKNWYFSFKGKIGL
ncbi:MAG TPA: RagB/SusD family nutrient uptake outer membrane protein [Prevotella sp.]|nr:RagB/SusD family nutrient uptake outer membrane protein [Prevotella sp.]